MYLTTMLVILLVFYFMISPLQSFAQMMGGPIMPNGPIVQSPSLQEYKMASSGDNVYIAWSMQDPGQGMSLYFEKSSDGGKTFGNKMLIANSTRIDKPDLTAYNNSVYVTWNQQENASKIMVRRSIDGGVTFQNAVTVNTGDATLFTIGGITSYGNNVNLIWTGSFGPNRTQDVMASQSTDGGATFGDPVLLSDGLLQSNEQKVVQSGSSTYVVWSSLQNCHDPMGGCNTMAFLLPISDGKLGKPVHLEQLDGIFPISVAANSDTVLVEGLKRTFDDAVFDNSTLVIMQSHDRGSTFSTMSSTYNVYMAGISPVLTDSTLYQFWTVYELGLEPEPIYVERSTDDGKTFDTPQEVGTGTTPIAVQLDLQSSPYGDSAGIVWLGKDKAGSQHVFFDKIMPDSLGRVRTIEDVYQAGRFQLSQSSSGLYIMFGAGQNLFFESVNDTGYVEAGLLCPINQDPQPGSVLLDTPQAMVDGMPAQSVLTQWDVAANTGMHTVHDETSKVVYQIQAMMDGNVTFQSRENATVSCGYSPSSTIDWFPQSPGNYTLAVSLLNPQNLTQIISSSNQTVQVSENKYLGNFSDTVPVQFNLVNDSVNVDQGGWAKFSVKAGPSSPNYRLHDISLWIDGPRGIDAWFDKYSIFSYDYKLDNLTMYVYAGSAASSGVDQLKIEGKGVVANLLNGTISDIGNPMPPPSNMVSQFPFVITSEHENGRQIGLLNIKVNQTNKPASYAVIGPPNLHPFKFCSKEPLVNGNGGGTSCFGFVGYQDFPVMVYSDVPHTVNLGATNLPNGTWFRFLPQQVVATPSGTPSRLVMAGAEEPFMINVLDVQVGRIYSNTTQDSSVTFVPLISNEKTSILDGKGPIEFAPVSANINSTTPSSSGLVYDSASGSLPVSLSILGISQNGTTSPLPSWLSVNIVPSSFTLNYSQPFFVKTEVGTHAPPPGSNATILVGERIGGANYTGHIQVSVPHPAYFGMGGMMSPVNPVPAGLQLNTSSAQPTTDAKDTKCKATFVSITNAEDGRMACVKPETVPILEERGWAK